MVKAVQWTRRQQTNSLAAIEIVEELLAGGDKHGPIDAMLGIVKRVSTPDDLIELTAGLLNVTAMVVEHFSAATGRDQFQILRDTETLVNDIEIID